MVITKKLLYYSLLFFIAQAGLLPASEDDNKRVTLYTPSPQQPSNYDGCVPSTQNIDLAGNQNPPSVASGCNNPGGNNPNPNPGNSGGDVIYMSATMNFTQYLMNTVEYQKALNTATNAHTAAINTLEKTLTGHADAIINAILSDNMFEALHIMTSFKMPDNTPSPIVKIINEFNSEITHLLFNKSGNDDVYGAPRDLATINPQEIRAVYTNHISALAKIHKTTIPVNFSIAGKNYSIPTGIKYRVVPPASQTKLLWDFNKHPALCNIQASHHWWSAVTKWLWSFVSPRKVSESFSSAIQDNRYAKELHTLSSMHANKNYQSILNRLNDLSQLDKAYPRLRAIAQAARDQQLAQDTLEQINAIAVNPDLAYQGTPTQPLLTTATEQATPSNSIAQQEVSGEASAQQEIPANDIVTQPTVFEKTSAQKISFSAEAMQAALSQARSELEAQKSDITVRFSPRLGQLVFNFKSQQSQASTPAALMQQAESSAPATLAQHIGTLSPVAQELLSSCGLTPPARAVAPEHQLFLQQSDTILNNAAQAYQDGTVSDVTVAEIIVLTRTAQELAIIGKSDKATTLLTIAAQKYDGSLAPAEKAVDYMPDIFDDYAADAAAADAFVRIFKHAGYRIAHNVKHPGEFVHRQANGIKNLASGFMSIAKILSEDDDLIHEGFGEIQSAAQALWEATKVIAALSEDEREQLFGNLLGDSLVDMVAFKSLGKAGHVAQAIKSKSTAIIESTAHAFKGNKPLVPLYENAIKKIPKPEPLVAVYDAKTNSWRVPDAAANSGIQKFTGSKAPQTYKPGTRIVSGTCKMPPPPKFANPHSVRKRTTPALPAVAATSSAGSKQSVGKGVAPVASSSGTGQPASTTQSAPTMTSNVASVQTSTTRSANKQNRVAVKGYDFLVQSGFAPLLIQAEPYLEAIGADIVPIAELYNLTRTGFADFANKYIKLTYKHALAPEFGAQRSGNVKLTGFHHDMNGVIEQSGIITLVDKRIDPFGCYAGKPVFNGQTLSEKTLFPQSWSREKVISKIFEAYDNFKASGATNYTITDRDTYAFKAYTNEGIEIYFDITKNGVINTCYPIVK